MNHKFEQKVYYSDTDAYGVVWHGSYLRWLEMGRVDMCESFGYTLIELQEQDIALPVVNINVRYKASAKLNDSLIIETAVQKFTPLSVTFEQKISDKTTGKVFVEAVVDVVAINNSGKLYRRMPEVLTTMFKKAITKDEKDGEYALK